METRKVIWGIVGILGLGFVIFNNFDSSIKAIQDNIFKLWALLISLIVSVIYGIYNKKEIFK